MNREIEKKYRVYGICSIDEILETARKVLKDQISITGVRSLTGMDIDTYWKLEDWSGYATLRLRRSQEGTGEITIKVKDQTTTLNRVEENLYINDPEKARKMLEMLHGPYSSEIAKTYCKYTFLGGELAVYRVSRGVDHYYLEVEASSEKEVLRLCKILEKKMDLVHEPKSMSELYTR